jgi:hypothetical protein
MRDLHPKLSVWEKLYTRWEHRQSNSSCASEMRAGGAAGERLNAMEIELRAMNARADSALTAAVAALRSPERPR